MSDPPVHIGEVVTRTGLSHRTIRYYEEMGLLTPSARTEGGFRLYDEADIDRLLLIKPMKPLGFSVDAMRQLLDALDTLSDPGTSTADLAAARAQVGSIQKDALTRVAELKEATERAELFTRTLGSALVAPRPTSQ